MAFLCFSCIANLCLPEDWLLQERRHECLKLTWTPPTTRGPGLIPNVLSILLLDGAICRGRSNQKLTLLVHKSLQSLSTLVPPWIINIWCQIRGLPLNGVEQNFGHTVGPHFQVSQCAIYQRRPFQHISRSPASLANFTGARLNASERVSASLLIKTTHFLKLVAGYCSD